MYKICLDISTRKDFDPRYFFEFSLSFSTKSRPLSNSWPAGNFQKSNPGQPLGNIFELIPGLPVGGCIHLKLTETLGTEYDLIYKLQRLIYHIISTLILFFFFFSGL